MQTLVLTQGYLPHRIVGWQKAITMFFTGKVEVVETYADVEIRSVSLRLEMPAVVRLVKHVRAHEPRIRFSRSNVLHRDRFTCQYCGFQGVAKELTLDHVVPRSAGGRTSWENIVTACKPCNGKKGARSPAQAGLKLRRAPVRPRALPFKMRMLRVASPVPDPWKTWVWWDNDAA